MQLVNHVLSRFYAPVRVSHGRFLILKSHPHSPTELGVTTFSFMTNIANHISDTVISQLDFLVFFLYSFSLQGWGLYPRPHPNLPSTLPLSFGPTFFFSLLYAITSLLAANIACICQESKTILWNK